MIDLSEPSNSSYHPSLAFLPSSRTREHRLQLLPSHSPRRLVHGSYVNSPLSSSMTLPEDQAYSGYHLPPIASIHNDLGRGPQPPHYGLPLVSQIQPRPQYLLPPISPQVYPTHQSHPSYPLLAREHAQTHVQVTFTNPLTHPPPPTRASCPPLVPRYRPLARCFHRRCHRANRPSNRFLI